MSSTLQLLYKQYSEICTISQKLKNIKDQVDSVWATDIAKLNKLHSQAKECSQKAEAIEQKLKQVIEFNTYELSKESETFFQISKVSSETSENAKFILEKIGEKNAFGQKLNNVMENLIGITASIASRIIRNVGNRLSGSSDKYLPS